MEKRVDECGYKFCRVKNHLKNNFSGSPRITDFVKFAKKLHPLMLIRKIALCKYPPFADGWHSTRRIFREHTNNLTLRVKRCDQNLNGINMILQV